MPNLFGGRPLWSYLPVGNLLYDDPSPPSGLKILFEISYAVVGFFYVVLVYPALTYETGSFNPISQIKIKNQQIKLYGELNNKIFGPGGFADINFDKKVDIHEKANAYAKLGLNEFPKEDLTLEQLEELVKKYMGDN